MIHVKYTAFVADIFLESHHRRYEETRPSCPAYSLPGSLYFYTNRQHLIFHATAFAAKRHAYHHTAALEHDGRLMLIIPTAPESCTAFIKPSSIVFISRSAM